jgi:transposase
MAGLWEIEAEIRGRSPQARMKLRQERSAAIVAKLFKLWETELPSKRQGDRTWRG